MSETDPVQMCFARLGDVVIAFEASSVTRFTDSTESSQTADVDAAGSLDIDLGGALLARRWAIVDLANRTLSVALGTQLQFGAIARGCLWPLPALLRDMASRTGLLGIVRWEEGFAFVVDLKKLGDAPTALAAP